MELEEALHSKARLEAREQRAVSERRSAINTFVLRAMQLDLAFLVDVTGSMQPSINMVLDKVGPGMGWARCLGHTWTHLQCQYPVPASRFQLRRARSCAPVSRCLRACGAVRTLHGMRQRVTSRELTRRSVSAQIPHQVPCSTRRPQLVAYLDQRPLAQRTCVQYVYRVGLCRCAG